MSIRRSGRLAAAETLLRSATDSPSPVEVSKPLERGKPLGALQAG